MVRMLAATLIGLILASTVQAHEALQQRYRRLPTKQIAAELDRYCAGGHAPCAYSPPQPLLDARRRGAGSYSLSLQHRDRAASWGSGLQAAFLSNRHQ